MDATGKEEEKKVPSSQSWNAKLPSPFLVVDF
jgi:hypothetical protein